MAFIQACPGGVTIFVTALSFGWSLFVATSESLGRPSDECMVCHGTEDILSLSQKQLAFQVVPPPPDFSTGPKQKDRFGDLSLYVDPQVFSKSVHGEFECVSCHLEVEEIPHSSRLQAVNCALCHGDIAEKQSLSAHGSALAEGSVDAPLCQDCHGSHDIRRTENPESRMHPLNQAFICSRCHNDKDVMLRAGAGIPAASKSYKESVHYKALQNGNLNAPTCSGCHRSHDVLPSWNPLSSIFPANQINSCGECHPEVAQQYEDSVHGRGVLLGNPDLPSCSDCHNAHLILSGADERSPSHPKNISSITCPKCHASDRIIRRYGLRPDSVKSFEESYHGLAGKFGDTSVANCALCHGAHDTKRATDPESRIHPSNLVDTCAQCHPGATPRFASTPIHISATSQTPTPGIRVQRWVRGIYFVLIPLIIGFMLFHNLVDFVKKIRSRYDRWKEPGGYLRMSLNERIQHMLLMVTFVILVISGFALSFHWEIPFVGGEFSQKLRSLIHRVAGLIFILYFVYHLLWLRLSSRGSGFIRSMIPRLKDLRDLQGVLMFNLGLAQAKPKFDRFSYVEKVEYWALLWGGTLMIATGLILWFEREAIQIIPPWLFNVANLIHYYEAVLATLAIIVWHFYSVLANPDVAPMAMHWLTGTLPEDVLKGEYRLEWERWKKRRTIGEGSSSE